MTSIKDNTPIKDFPAIYNGDMEELNVSIKSLNDSIEAIKGDNGIIKNLKEAFNSAISRIRGEYISMFDKWSEEFDKLTAFESEFERIDSRLSSIEERLTALEESLSSDNTEDNQ